MIEWWQAVLISGASALVTGGVALLVQRRQLHHERDLHHERLEADRQSEREEALRASRRERLQPVYDLLGELDGWLAWQSLLSATEEAKGPAREILVKRYPDVDVDSILTKAVGSLEERGTTHKPPPDLINRLLAVIPRVPGIDLDVFALMGALNQKPDNWGHSMSVLRRLHDRVEAFATKT